jgi:hypothetical protein
MTDEQTRDYLMRCLAREGPGLVPMSQENALIY